MIRDDGTIEVYEILQLSCELLSERIKFIASEKECPEDLKSTIATLIWASNRVDIPEMIIIRKQFKAKYGKKFEQDALANANGICNERVVAKLSFQPPTAFLVQTYLEKIADQFNVDWKPIQQLKANELAGPMAAPVGSSVPFAPGSGLVATEAFPINAGEEVSVITETSSSVQAPPASTPSAPAAQFPVAPSTATTKSDDNIPFAKVMSMPPSHCDEEISSAENENGGLDQNSKNDRDGTNGTDTSYEALQARFANLRN